MSNLLIDLKHAIRSLLRSPGFMILACLSIAVGIGLNTAVFSFANALLLRPLPGREPSRLVEVHKHAEGNPFGVISYPVFRKLEQEDRLFESTAVSCELEVNVSRDGSAERRLGIGVSGSYFPTLGLQPFRGRLLDRSDDAPKGSKRNMVVSHRYWRNQLGEDPETIGKTLTIYGQTYTISGVTPPGFDGLFQGLRPDFYLPITNLDELSPGGLQGYLEREGNNFLQCFGRLKTGVNLPQANLVMAQVSPALFTPENGSSAAKRDFISLKPLASLPSFLAEWAKIGLLVIQVLVLLVLGVAMSNVTHLQLVRAMTRRKEFAVRLSLGAGRWPLIRQLLAESLILSLVGAGLGLLLAVMGLRALQAIPLPLDVPHGLDLGLDTRVLLFTLLLAMITGILFGLVPAWQGTRPDLVQVLRDESNTGSRTASRTRRLFVMAQVAISLILLVTSGLFLRSLAHASNLDLGFERHRALLFDLEPGQLGYSKEQSLAFYDSLRQGLDALPGVQGSALCTLPPLSLGNVNGSYRTEHQDPGSQDKNATLNTVTPDYLRVMGIGLKEGRSFRDQDRPGAPEVVIVSESLAQAAWPGQSAVGKRLLRGEKTFDVIGVARNHKLVSRGEMDSDLILRPLAQDMRTSVTVIVRTEGDPRALLSSMRALVRRLDSGLPVTDLITMEQHLRTSLFPVRLAAGAAALFGLMALVLSMTGVYGVMSHSVEQRRKEIGIRMAIGARVVDVVRMIVAQGMTTVAIGLAVGLFLAFAATRLFSSLLYELNAADPLTYIGVTLLLAACACLACLLPSLRAAHQNPSEILRS